MRFQIGLTRGLMVAAVTALVGLSVLSMRSLETGVHTYRTTETGAVYWRAAEIELALADFVAALEREETGARAQAAGAIAARVDRLRNRAEGLLATQSGQGLATAGVVAALLTTLDSQLGIEAATGERRGAAARFAAFQEPLRRLSVELLTEERRQHAELRRHLLATSRLTFWVWAATLFICILLCNVMLVESRRNKRMLREAARLTEDARDADRSQSQFLTMMSHELRTPMNGVMGLLALIKQSGLSPRQSRLIDEAERSGSHMVGLLRDMLDFSDLQGGKIALAAKPLETEELVRGIEGALSSRARRLQLEHSVESGPGLPDMIRGDIARLRQALSYFCIYFAEIVRAREIRVSVTHDGENLRCRIDVGATLMVDTVWRPEEVLGKSARGATAFASDSVGPMIARGLVKLMRGRLSLTDERPERVVLEVSVPAPPVAPVRSVVRIEVRSDTSALLLHSLLDDKRWDVWTPRAPAGEVAAVIVEGTLPDAGALAEGLRGEHRSARIISLGTPGEPSLFDAVCPMPPGVGSLAQALEPEPATERVA